MEQPNEPPIEFSLNDLADPRYFTLLNLLVEDRKERPRIEEEISIEAGEVVGKLYDLLLHSMKIRSIHQRKLSEASTFFASGWFSVCMQKMLNCSMSIKDSSVISSHLSLSRSMAH